MNKYIFTQGKEAKAIDLTNPIRDSWDFVEAMGIGEGTELYAKVAAVYRAMQLQANAVANLNYAVVRNGEDVDTFEDWQNTIGLMPDPRDLIRRWTMSLFETNTAYGRIAKTNAVKRELFYVLPDTIKIKTANGGLDKFERWIDGVKVDEYKPMDGRFVYMWKLDHKTELLPTPYTDFMALSQAAGILFSADYWTQNYFQNGAVKPTILAVKGLASVEKREELQNSFARFMRGIANRFADLAKIINAETMDVKQIGDGLGDIKDSPVYRQAIENIAIASGMPLSLLLANSANYATAQTEYAAWYRDNIIPTAKWIVAKLNMQLPMSDAHLEVRPEQSEPSQEEEVQRAGAFQTYVNSGIPLHIAAQIVGIDLPSGMEYEDLMPKEPQPEPPVEDTEDDDEEMPMKAWDELNTWRKKAVRFAKRGKAATFEFTTEHIPADIADGIRKRLQIAGTPDEVKAAFEITPVEEVKDDSEIKLLADALNNAAEALKADSYSPPEAVQKNARRGLELRKKHGKGGLTTQEAGEQGIGSGVARATSLANGERVSIETIRRMSAFFSRHEKNKEGGEDDAGYIAWLLWGGDAGRTWADSILKQEDDDN